MRNDASLDGQVNEESTTGSREQWRERIVHCFFLFDPGLASPSLDVAALSLLAVAAASVAGAAELDPKNSFCLRAFSSSACLFAFASATASPGNSHCTNCLMNATRLYTN